jgi:ketosteroid isomerase-like protein
MDTARLVKDLLDAWNAHDVERAASFYAPDYVGEDVGQAAPQRGAHQRVHVLAAFTRAFPDIPPTGREIEVRGVSLLTVEDGKITHGLNVWDTAGLLRALRLLPEL